MSYNFHLFTLLMKDTKSLFHCKCRIYRDDLALVGSLLHGCVTLSLYHLEMRDCGGSILRYFSTWSSIVVCNHLFHFSDGISTYHCLLWLCKHKNVNHYIWTICISAKELNWIIYFMDMYCTFVQQYTTQ